MPFIPNPIEPEANTPAPSKPKKYALLQDYVTAFGTYPAGSKFTIVFMSEDKTFAQIEDAEPNEGEVGLQYYVPTELLKGAPKPVKTPEAYSPSPNADPVPTPPLVVETPIVEASTAPVEVSANTAN